MTIERAIFSQEDPAAEAASLARTETDIAAGRIVAHEEVAKWLKASVAGDRQPMPREWLE